MKALKLTILVMATCLFFHTHSTAQENIAKLTPVGIFSNSGDGFGAGYYLGAGFEKVFSEKISGQINLGGSLRGAGAGFFSINDNRFIIKPEFAVYLMDVAPYSLYVGGAVSFGFGGFGGVFVGLAPQVGYQFFLLDDQLTIDVNFEGGLGILTAGGGNFGFHSLTGVSVGYAF